MLYPMTNGSQWGLIDRQGTWFVQPNYDAVCFPTSDAIMVKKNGLPSMPNSTLSEPFLKGVPAPAKGVWGYIDSHGQWLQEPRYAWCGAARGETIHSDDTSA